MRKQDNFISERVFVPEDLEILTNTECRKVETSGRRAKLIFQNPDTGRRLQLSFDRNLFDGECLKIRREE